MAPDVRAIAPSLLDRLPPTKQLVIALVVVPTWLQALRYTKRDRFRVAPANECLRNSSRSCLPANTRLLLPGALVAAVVRGLFASRAREYMHRLAMLAGGSPGRAVIRYASESKE